MVLKNGKYSKGLKIDAALTGMGGSGAILDPEVIGARGRAKSLGRSVDQAEGKKIPDVYEARFRDSLAVKEERHGAKAAAAAAAFAAAEEPFTKAKEAQLLALKRRGRRASILTSPQGVTDPLGIPG
jgi:hypothetical protein